MRTLPTLQIVDTSVLARLKRAAERGITSFIRQSTDTQKEENIGSGLAQQEWVQRMLRRFELLAFEVLSIDARGEGATRTRKRPKFKTLINFARRGRVGVILVPSHDRLSRDSRLAQELFEICRALGIFLIIGENLYDPSLPRDRLMLQLFSALAEHDVDQRKITNASARLSLAQRRQLLLSLPTGLVWANPNDTDYSDAIPRTLLEEWRARLKNDPTEVYDGTRRVWVMPYPNPDVVATVNLRLQWLMETRSITKVYERILAGADGWPMGKAGLVPVTRQWIYRRGMELSWIKSQRQELYDYLRIPALYGIYSFVSTVHSHPADLPAQRRVKQEHYPRLERRRQSPLPDGACLAKALLAPQRDSGDIDEAVAEGLHEDLDPQQQVFADPDGDDAND
jgi:DNA invertase Pin-like site-specific DNA recombinase